MGPNDRGLEGFRRIASSKTASRRCSRCGISWPPNDEYVLCPKCQEKTDPISNDLPGMSPEEARSMKNRFEFDRFYEKWDAAAPESRLEPTDEDRERFQLPDRTIRKV